MYSCENNTHDSQKKVSSDLTSVVLRPEIEADTSSPNLRHGRAAGLVTFFQIFSILIFELAT